MKNLINLFLLATISISSFGQQVENPSKAVIPKAIIDLDKHYQKVYENVGQDLTKVKGTGYIPYQRSRHFYEERRDMNGNINEKKRWEIYEQIRSQNKSLEQGEPVANWENIGPLHMDGQGGRVISHAFDPLVPNTLWVGSASGGLWLTEDSGESWQAMTDDIPSVGVGSVVVHPNNSDIIVIGTGEGFTAPGFFMKGGVGTFKSIDHGQTWTPTSFQFPSSAGISVLKMVWHPTDHNIIWMATSFGLWKSVDMGDNWNLILGDGTNHGNSIYDDIIINEANPDIIFVGHENNGVIRSIDGGVTFEILNNGIPISGINFISIAECLNEPNVIYASITDNSNSSFKGLYKTEDYGDTWVQISSAPETMCFNVDNLSYCQGWYVNTVGVSPINPDIVFVGGITLWRSEDGGESWSQKDTYSCPTCVNTPPCKTFVDHHDLGYDPFNNTTCYSFNDGGVSKSTDDGVCFSHANEGLVTAQFYSIASSLTNPDVNIGGFQDHGLQGKDGENGLVWEKWGFLDGADVEVHPNNENRFFGTWIDGTYWRNYNGLNSFASAMNNGLNLNENVGSYFAPIRIHPTNPSIMLGATQGAIYRTENSGTLWQSVQPASVISDLAFSQADPSVCYATAWTGSSWLFYRSSDTGITWQTTNSAPGWRVTDIKTSGLNSQTVFSTRNSINPFNPHVLKSTNGGDSWVSIQGDLPDLTVNALAVDHTNDDIIYVGTDLGVFVTCNGGQNWTEFNHNLPVTFVNDIEYNPTDHVIRIGTYGRGAWMADALQTESVSINEFSSYEVNNIEVFPNPNIGNFSLRFSLNNKENVRISIHNYLGQFIKDISNSTLDAGNHEVPIDISVSMNKFGAGVYFARIKTGNRAFFEKIVLHD